MTSYDDFKNQAMEEDHVAVDTVPQKTVPQQNPYSSFSYLVSFGLVILLLGGIIFGIPQFVDGGEPTKSKTQNRWSMLQWFADTFDEPAETAKRKQQQTERGVGPLDSAFD